MLTRQIRGPGTAFRCVPAYFNHCYNLACVSSLTDYRRFFKVFSPVDSELPK